MQRNFVAGGGASTVLAIANDAGIPLAKTQRELTPLQRMVLTMGMQEAQKEAKNQQAPAQNSLAAGTGGAGGNKMSGETVKYVNEGT